MEPVKCISPYSTILSKMATTKTMVTAKSNETKCATNYSIITNNNNNWIDTHNNMQLTMQNKYTNDDIHTNDCVVHIVR